MGGEIGWPQSPSQGGKPLTRPSQLLRVHQQSAGEFARAANQHGSKRERERPKFTARMQAEAGWSQIKYLVHIWSLARETVFWRGVGGE
jgi:hypothetical protein